MDRGGIKSFDLQPYIQISSCFSVAVYISDHESIQRLVFSLCIQKNKDICLFRLVNQSRITMKLIHPILLHWS